MLNKQKNKKSTLGRTLSIFCLSVLLLFTGMFTELHADESEVYASKDGNIQIVVDRHKNEDTLKFEMSVHTKEDTNLLDIEHEFESILKEPIKAELEVNENGNYRIITTYTLEGSEEKHYFTFELKVQSFLDDAVDGEVIEMLPEDENPTLAEVTGEDGKNMLVIDEDGEFQSVPYDEIVLEDYQSDVLDDGNPDELTYEELEARLNGNGKWLPGTYSLGLEEGEGTRRKRSVGSVVNVTLHGSYVTGVDFHRTPDHPDYHPSWQFYDWSFGKMTVNGKAVFCIDPETKIPTGTGYVGGTNWGYLSYSKQREIINTVNYGYGYDGDTSNAMHWATQNRVWELAGWYVTWGSLDATPQYNTIKNRVANHRARPSWHNTTKNVKVGDTVDLSESIMSDFKNPDSMPAGLQVVESSGSTFKVKVLPGFKQGKISMEKKSANVQGTSVVYRKPGEQTFISVYSEDPVYTEITLRVQSANYRVYKKGENNEPLSGHKFRFSYSNSVDENGFLNGTHWDFVTGEDGYTPYDTWNNDGATVYIQEIEAKAPYLLNKEIKTITVSAGETKSIEFSNVKAQGQFILGKYDDHGKRAIATYDVLNSSNTVVDTITTSLTKDVKSQTLPLGKYKLQEKSVNGNLVINPEIIEIELKYKDQVTPIVLSSKDFINKYQRTNITFTKVEDNSDPFNPENHGKKLAGVELALIAKTDIYEGATLVYRAGEIVGKRVTNSVGQVTWHNVAIGEYKVEELKTLEGYQLFEGHWDVSVVFDGTKPTVSVLEIGKTVSNTSKYGSVELLKRDSKYGNRLEGAIFELSYQGKVLGTYTSDVNGRIVVDGLRASTGGAYEFNEIAAPDKYWMDTAPIVFDITEHNQTVYLDAPNVLIETHVQFRKLNETFEALPGVEFSIRDIATGDFVTLKHAYNGEVIEETAWTTNEQGKVFINGYLTKGKYQLVETKPLPGFQPIAPIDFTVDENSDFIDLGVMVGLSLDLGDIINEWNRGDIKIQKLDATTGLPLAGFGFELYDAEDERVLYVETGMDGTVTIPNNLYGFYTVKEVHAPGNYVIDPNNNAQRIFVEEHGKTYTVTFGNVETHVLVRKLDKKTQEPIPGTIFEFYQDGEFLFEKETDEFGEIKLSGYDFSTITIKEIFVPKPWIIDSENNIQQVTLTQDTPVHDVLFENERAVGEDRLIKRDAKNNSVIGGVTYKYYDITEWLEENLNQDVEISNSNPENLHPSYEELLEMEPFATIITDDKGEAVLGDLDIERTYVRIESDAPYGYKVNQEVNFVIFEYVDQETPVIVQKSELFNERIQVTIRGEKRDSITKNLIPSSDFVLQLKDKDGNIVEHKMFKEGVYTWTVDALEIYELSETKAPNGYLLSDEVIVIDTSKEVDGNIYTIEYLNEMMPVTYLPKTGEPTSYVFYASLCIVLIGIIIFLIPYLKNSKSNSDSGSSNDLKNSDTETEGVKVHVEKNDAGTHVKISLSPGVYSLDIHNRVDIPIEITESGELVVLGNGDIMSMTDEITIDDVNQIHESEDGIIIYRSKESKGLIQLEFGSYDILSKEAQEIILQYGNQLIKLTCGNMALMDWAVELLSRT